MRDYRHSIFSQTLGLARRATLYATRAAMRADQHPWPCVLAGLNQTLQVIDNSGEFLFSAVGVANAVGWPELVANNAAVAVLAAQGDAADVAMTVTAKGTGQALLLSPTGTVVVSGSVAAVNAGTGTLDLTTTAAQPIRFYTTNTLRWIIAANGSLQGEADAGTLPCAITRVEASQNDVQNALSLERTSSGGAGQNNIGVGLLLRAESTTGGTSADAVQLAAVLTDAAVATATSSFQVRTRTGGGALGVTATFAGDGSGTLTGDIQAAGGYRQTLGPWQEVDVAAGKADAVVPITPTAGAIAGVPVVRAGSVVGIVAILDAALTSTDANAASITVSIHVNGGAALAETCVLDAPGGGGAGEALQITLIAKDLRALAAGDIITVSTASTANIAAAARDLTVMVQIEG